MSFLRECYQREKGLVWTGGAGILLGFIGMIGYLIQGNFIPPEGLWTKAITFNLGIGIFTLTTAVVMPWIKLTKVQRKRFHYTLIPSIWVGYAIETIQNARGFDPRFTKVGSIWDQLAGMVFGFICLLITVCLVYVLIRLWKDHKRADGFNLSLRYGFLSNLLGVLSGVWMILLQGRMTGEGVDIMLLHFIGFHGYQAVPIIAWLLKPVDGSIPHPRRMIHLGGLAWMALYLFLLFQFAFGYSVFDLTVYSLLALSSLILYLVAVMFALLGRFLWFVFQVKN